MTIGSGAVSFVVGCSVPGKLVMESFVTVHDVLSLWIRIFYHLIILSSVHDYTIASSMSADIIDQDLIEGKLHLLIIAAVLSCMTVLFLHAGAPDIFVAFSALQDDDVPLVLG